MVFNKAILSYILRGGSTIAQGSHPRREARRLRCWTSASSIADVDLVAVDVVRNEVGQPGQKFEREKKEYYV